MTEETDPLPHDPAAFLSLRNVTKTFGNFRANDSVNLDVRPGEIHAIIGENGAGKSTLMKLINGSLQPDGGEIRIDDRPVAHTSTIVARENGVGMVHQHFALFDTLSPFQNLRVSTPRTVSDDSIRAKLDELEQKYGLPLPKGKLVHDLPVGLRQKIEIIRCLLQNPRLIILDEPTSVLPPQAVEALFEVLEHLKNDGVAVIIISHKLDEIKRLADRVTVLRGGKSVVTCEASSKSTQELAELMIGGKLMTFRERTTSGNAAVLSIRNLSVDNPDPDFHHLQVRELDVNSKEIVGVAGIAGNGQNELAMVLSGELTTPGSLALTFKGQSIDALSILGRRALGFGYVAEDRHRHSALSELSLVENTALTSVTKVSLDHVRRGVLQNRKIAAFGAQVIEDYRVKCSGVTAPAATLSGGNLQKFIVGRELALEPDFLLIAQPTWGVDAQAARMIHNRIIALREAGASALIISEDIDELLALCDRIAVLAEGVLSEAVPTSELTADRIGLMMTRDTKSELDLELSATA